MQYQFHSGYLPASHLLDKRRFNFLAKLQNVEYSQNEFLLHQLRMSDFHDVSVKYFNDNLRHNYLTNFVLWSYIALR